MRIDGMSIFLTSAPSLLSTLWALFPSRYEERERRWLLRPGRRAPSREYPLFFFSLPLPFFDILARVWSAVVERGGIRDSASERVPQRDGQVRSLGVRVDTRVLQAPRKYLYCCPERALSPLLIRGQRLRYLDPEIGS